jgi:hypothetical protein
MNGMNRNKYLFLFSNNYLCNSCFRKKKQQRNKFSRFLVLNLAQNKEKKKLFIFIEILNRIK